MKIYRKIRIDIETGRTIEEDSFEYQGPVASCFGPDSDAEAGQSHDGTESGADHGDGSGQGGENGGIDSYGGGTEGPDYGEGGLMDPSEHGGYGSDPSGEGGYPIGYNNPDLGTLLEGIQEFDDIPNAIEQDPQAAAEMVREYIANNPRAFVDIQNRTDEELQDLAVALGIAVLGASLGVGPGVVSAAKLSKQIYDAVKAGMSYADAVRGVSHQLVDALPEDTALTVDDIMSTVFSDDLGAFEDRSPGTGEGNYQYGYAGMNAETDTGTGTMSDTTTANLSTGQEFAQLFQTGHGISDVGPIEEIGFDAFYEGVKALPPDSQTDAIVDWAQAYGYSPADLAKFFNLGAFQLGIEDPGITPEQAVTNLGLGSSTNPYGTIGADYDISDQMEQYLGETSGATEEYQGQADQLWQDWQGYREQFESMGGNLLNEIGGMTDQMRDYYGNVVGNTADVFLEMGDMYNNVLGNMSDTYQDIEPLFRNVIQNMSDTYMQAGPEYDAIRQQYDTNVAGAPSLNMVLPTGMGGGSVPLAPKQHMAMYGDIASQQRGITGDKYSQLMDYYNTGTNTLNSMFGNLTDYYGTGTNLLNSKYGSQLNAINSGTNTLDALYSGWGNNMTRSGNLIDQLAGQLSTGTSNQQNLAQNLYNVGMQGAAAQKTPLDMAYDMLRLQTQIEGNVSAADAGKPDQPSAWASWAPAIPYLAEGAGDLFSALF